MSKPMRIIALAAFLAAFLAPAALAAPIGREVIVLYRAEGGTELRSESLLTASEVVLNHLGLVVRYHDVTSGLPDAALSARARGVVALVEGAATDDPAAYARWLQARLAAGQRVMLLGGADFLQASAAGAPVPSAAWQPVLSGLGVSPAGAAGGGTLLPGPHTGFEAGYDASAMTAAPWRSLDPANRPFLSVRSPGGEAAPLALVGPKGAVAASFECLRYVNPISFRLQWRVDPFWLYATGLGTGGEPALDTTTINGRRLFYAHIDGDGFANPAIRRAGGLASEVVRDEVLRQTPLPTTVSVIAGELSGRPRLEAIARSIFRLPHVQAASHSYSHPHDWVKGTVTPEGGIEAGEEAAHAAISRAISPEGEVDASVRYIETLLPPGKRVEAMLWSGMTNPSAPYLARAAARGLANMNGGDAMLDSLFPSYANLSPLARRVGPHLQILTSAANENLFTNLWTGPFDGQRQALPLFRFQGAPRRVAPVNIYYHFYAAERLAGLGVLKGLYRWAEAQPLCHVTVARYCRLVEGFFSGRITPEGPSAWRVEGAGACRTLRFDHPAGVPDLARSEHVAGYTRAHGSLYVHLTAPEALVVLAASPAPMPHLREASAPLASWTRHGRSIAARFEAEAPATLVLAGFSPGAPLTIAGDFKGPARADQAGSVRLIAAPGSRQLEVRW